MTNILELANNRTVFPTMSLTLVRRGLQGRGRGGLWCGRERRIVGEVEREGSDVMSITK